MTATEVNPWHRIETAPDDHSFDVLVTDPQGAGNDGIYEGRRVGDRILIPALQHDSHYKFVMAWRWRS